MYPLTVARSVAWWAVRAFVLLGVLLLLCGPTQPAAQAETVESPPPAPILESQSTPVPRAAAGPDGAWALWQSLPTDVRAKVDPRILAELRGEAAPAHLAGSSAAVESENAERLTPRQHTRYIVFLRRQADLALVERRTYASVADKRTALVDTLRATAESSQTPLLALLSQRSASRADAAPAVIAYQPFYVVNAIAVEGDLDTLAALAQRDDISRIAANYPLVPLLPLAEDEETADGPAPAIPAERGADAPQSVDAGLYYWNLELVRADRVHRELGVRGAGAVVGGFDTGVNYRHPALLRQYRGNQNGIFDHNYNWFVPDTKLYANGDLGPSVTQTPSDCAGSTHGTHTMGTMVGEAPGNGPTIGLAPDARWIALPGICGETMPGGIHDDIGGIKAFQWFLCPTDLTGKRATANCGLAPDAVNSSWGSANPTGDTFRPIVQVLRAAGIAPVFASGNPSAGPGSIGSPANIPEAITVGSTTAGDNLSYFSGQGPSFWPGEQKPELTAPGSNVRSSVDNSGYDSYSGTSMAAPHVAGLIALLVSVDLEDGERDFSVDDLEALMTASAVDLGESGPDDRFGYGRVDSWAAVQLARTAGSLRGQVLDQEHNRPIGHALIEARNAGMTRTFTTRADAAGLYTMTLPAGDYQITLGRWGYVTTEVSLQPVIAGGLMLNDFRMLSMPVATINGTVRDEAGPVANALIYPLGNPAVNTRSDSSGRYQLALPLGANEVVVDAPKHRRFQTSIRVPGTGGQFDLTLRRGPSILVVDPSPLGGWFLGWPVHHYFTRALTAENYRYDLWQIQYQEFFGTEIGADGSTRYGLPSLATLQSYDVVVWLPSFCNDMACDRNSLAEIGFEDTLIQFLDGGGRLFVSGQDWAYTDRREKLFNVYMQAAYVSDYGGYRGMNFRSLDFLEGLNLELTNASLYGYPNGINFFAPDVVVPRTGSYAFPVLEYPTNEGAGAMAIAPCNASYRIFYLAAGLENIAPRGYEAQPDWTRLVDRAIGWLTGNQQQDRFVYALEQSSNSGAAGERINYAFSVTNLSTQSMRFNFQLQEPGWPTQILWQGTPVTGQVELGPCSSREFHVEVQIPYDSLPGHQDRARLIVSSASHSYLPRYESALNTLNSVQWREAPPAPTPLDRLASVSVGSAYHLLGGMASSQGRVVDEHWRFDACTQSWEARKPLPTALGDAAVGVIGDRIFVAGGRREVDGETVHTDSLYIYDLRTDSWSTGPAMPRALSAGAGAVLDGKFYVFGGWNGLEALPSVLVFDPAGNRWEERGVMAGGERYQAAAAALDGHIYLVGGLPYPSYFARYTPSTNAWTYRSAPSRSRVGPGLVATPGGMLYLLGGSNGRGLVERYDTAEGRWTSVNVNIERDRRSPGAAYAEGKLYLVGGSGENSDHESMRLAGSFCESNLIHPQTAVAPGGAIVYTVQMQGADVELPNVRLTAPLHPQEDFVGFLNPPQGIRLTENRAVEWTGRLGASGPPLTFGYTTTLRAGVWQPGDRITHTVQMENGAGRTLTRSATAQLFASDFAPSSKTVSQAQVSTGGAVTYTVHLRNSRPVGGPAIFTDTLPAGMEFVDGSIRLSAGAAGYDPARRTLVWQGNVAEDHPGYANLGDAYVWSDSAGRGINIRPEATWHDIRLTGRSVVSGFDEAVCGVDMGFPFPFYNTQTYSKFCVDVSGLLTLTDGQAGSNNNNLCPLPAFPVTAPRIAAVWSNLRVDEGVFVETFGLAPNRYTIVQWTGAYYLDIWDEFFGLPGTPDTDFQLVLHEDGRINLVILRIGPDEQAYSTTGLLGLEGNQRFTYQCDGGGYRLSDGLVVSFLPPGGTLPAGSEEVSFRALAVAGGSTNRTITNTVTLSGGGRDYTRSVPVVVDSVDLTLSSKRAGRSEVQVGENVGYTVTLRNQGLAVARSADLSDALPAGMSYVPGSLTCSIGLCAENSGTIAWQGDITPGGTVTVTYAAAMNGLLADRTPLTNTAYIQAAGVERFERAAVVLARGSGLGASYFDFGSAPIEPGDRFVFSVFLRNTGRQSADADFVLPLPTELGYVPNTLRCGIGQCRMDGNRLLWSGTLPPRGVVALLLDLKLAEGLPSGLRIPVQGQITDRTLSLTHTLDGGMNVAFHFFMPKMGEWIEKLFMPLVEHDSIRGPWVPVFTLTPTATPIILSPLVTPTPTATPTPGFVSPLPTPTRAGEQP